MKLVILSEAFENHSNRLFQSIHYEAYCIERGYRFYNTTFSDMATYYRGTKTNLGTCLLNSVPKSIFNNKNFKSIGIRQDSKDPSHIEWAYKLFPAVFVGGWDFRVHNLTEKLQDYFISKYTIKDRFLQGVNLVQHISQWKLDNYVVLGVHIRRGDYRTYENGRFFYSDCTYRHFAALLTKMLESDGRRVKIIAFSNDSTSINELIECELSMNEWYVDHHLMSQCDLLIGPPSTFTMWASYIGRVPYFHINSPSSPVGLSSFSLCRG